MNVEVDPGLNEISMAERRDGDKPSHQSRRVLTARMLTYFLSEPGTFQCLYLWKFFPNQPMLDSYVVVLTRLRKCVIADSTKLSKIL